MGTEILAAGCTFIIATGEWPFTNPPRCGDPARYQVVDDGGDIGYSCERHAVHILTVRGATVHDMWQQPGTATQRPIPRSLVNPDARPPCECGHRAWAHGTQTGSPAAGEACHAAIDEQGSVECPCPGGYREDGGAR